jgi:hypothetical protein
MMRMNADGCEIRLADAMTSRARDGESRRKSLELGLATEQEMDEMADAWEQWGESEDASMGMMHGEIIIQM